MREYDGTYRSPRWRITTFPVGIFCLAPRGGGWASERSNPQVRHERGAAVAVRGTRECYEGQVRVQFPDGSAHWYPASNVQFGRNNA